MSSYTLDFPDKSINLLWYWVFSSMGIEVYLSIFSAIQDDTNVCISRYYHGGYWYYYGLLRIDFGSSQSVKIHLGMTEVSPLFVKVRASLSMVSLQWRTVPQHL